MSRSLLITVVTFGSVVSSGAITIVWFATAHGTSRFEPVCVLLGLLGGLAGVLAEHRSRAQERRHLALMSLVDELQGDTAVLDDPRFMVSTETPRPRVYPRLPVSATDAALISGVLGERTDVELLRRLHKWRDEVNGFNRRLELTENRIFTTAVPTDITDFGRILHRSGYLAQVRHHRQDLQDYLAANYWYPQTQIEARMSRPRSLDRARCLHSGVRPARQSGQPHRRAAEKLSVTEDQCRGIVRQYRLTRNRHRPANTYARVGNVSRYDLSSSRFAMRDGNGRGLFRWWRVAGRMGLW